MAKPVIDLNGKICVICGVKIKEGKSTFARHHINYEKNIMILVCKGCHIWLHGHNLFNNPIKKEYPKEIAPYVFAKRVVDLYESNDPSIKSVNVYNFEGLLNSIKAVDELTPEETNALLVEILLRQQFEKKGE